MYITPFAGQIMSMSNQFAQLDPRILSSSFVN